MASEKEILSQKLNLWLENYLRQKYPETKMTSFMESLYQEASEKMKDMLFEE